MSTLNSPFIKQELLSTIGTTSLKADWSAFAPLSKHQGRPDGPLSSECSTITFEKQA